MPLKDGGWHLLPLKAPRSAPVLGSPQQPSRAGGAAAEDAAVRKHGKKGEGSPSLQRYLQPQSQDFNSMQARQTPTAAVARQQPGPAEAPSTLASHWHQCRRFPLHALTCHGASPPVDLSLRSPPVPLRRNCSFYSRVPRHEHARICLFKARLTYPGGKKEKLEASWKAQLVWHRATRLGGERQAASSAPSVSHCQGKRCRSQPRGPE